MKPTDILMDEHRVIEQVLDCLEVMTDRCSTSGKLDGASARAATEFFREFADRCHHAKEEAHLFPLLEARGLPRDGGPAGVMILEHEEGRSCVRGMTEEIDGAASGDPASVERFERHARHFVSLLRQHIDKEDDCLFPMANQALTPEDQEALEATFHRVEHEEMGTATHEKYLRVAGELAERFGVTKAVASSASARGE